MSDPEKDKKNPEVSAEDIVDAVVIEEEGPKEDQAEEDLQSAEPLSSEIDEENVAEDGRIEENISDTLDGETKETEPQPAAVPAEVRKGGFLPLVLGGVVAAGLGFGISQVIFPQGWPGATDTTAIEDLTATIQQQAGSIAALEKRLAHVETAPQTPAVNLGPLEGDLKNVKASVSDLASRLDKLEVRISEIEKRPAQGGAAASAVEAYEREVEALKELMAKQKAEVDALVASAEKEKASAEMTAHQALIRSAVSRVQIALDTGNGFSEALADLKGAGVLVPAVLIAVADEGVATLSQLSSDYPAAARKALASARKAEGSSGNLWNFFRNQLGMRSLEPKEGNDADAILSRAEAALADGRLTDMMAELQGLPEGARVELTDWMARASQRAEAIAAAEDLSAQVASN